MEFRKLYIARLFCEKLFTEFKKMCQTMNLIFLVLAKSVLRLALIFLKVITKKKKKVAELITNFSIILLFVSLVSNKSLLFYFC